MAKKTSSKDIQAKGKKTAKPKRPKAGGSKESVAAREARFIEAYITHDGNGKAAGIAAGFSPKTADQQASRLLKKVNVRDEIARRRAEALRIAQEETGLNVAEVLLELRSLIRSDLRQCFNPETGALLQPHEWPDDVARAMASVKVVEMAGSMKIGGPEGCEHVPMYTKEVKLWDKNAAIEKAMKHLGLYEQDNKQKVDPICELLKQVGGALPVKP